MTISPAYEYKMDEHGLEWFSVGGGAFLPIVYCQECHEQFTDDGNGPDEPCPECGGLVK